MFLASLMIGFLLKVEKVSKKEIGLEKVTRIIELSKKGVFTPEIARLVGVSESSVYKYRVLFDLI